MSSSNVITKQVLFIERAGLSTKSTFNILDAEGYLAESDYNIRISEGESNNSSLEVSGHIVADKFRGRSDLRLKSNVVDIKNALETIKKLTGKAYNLKSDTTLSYGFIAQDVQQVLPQMVGQDIDGTLMLSYMEFIPFIIESIKELDVKIDKIKTVLEKLAL